MEKNEFLNLNPMLLSEVSKPFDNENFLYEIKFDGIRALIFINKGKIIIKSRRGIILNDIYPELLDIKNIAKASCIFDGEIVLMDNGKPSFSRLQERSRLKNKYQIQFMQKNYPVTFVCFDIIYKNKDLKNLALIERKNILEKFKDTNSFVKTKYFFKEGKKLFKKIQEKNLEGIVAKEKNSLYYPNKRSKEWLKIKNFKTNEFYIGGYIDEDNKNMMVIYLGELVNKKLNFVGKTTLNKKTLEYQKIKKEQVLTSSPFSNYNSSECVYINPHIKVKVKYIEKTKSNHLRQPFI